MENYAEADDELRVEVGFRERARARNRYEVQRRATQNRVRLFAGSAHRDSCGLWALRRPIQLVVLFRDSPATGGHLLPGSRVRVNVSTAWRARWRIERD